MKVWCFKASGPLWALTNESNGAKLPAELGPWTLHREVELTASSDDEQQAMALIAEHGFCCFEAAGAA